MGILNVITKPVAFTLLVVTSCQTQSPPTQDSEVEKVFDVSDPQAGFQRSMVVEISPRQEDCFFIDGIGKGHLLNLHWNVLNSGPQGQSLDITMYMRDPIKNLITYSARETEGKKFALEMNLDGDYEICFSNR